MAIVNPPIPLRIKRNPKDNPRPVPFILRLQFLYKLVKTKNRIFKLDFYKVVNSKYYLRLPSHILLKLKHCKMHTYNIKLIKSNKKSYGDVYLMKKVIIFLCVMVSVGLLSSCQAIKHFESLPYKESVEIKEKRDLRHFFNPSVINDRSGYVYHYIKSNQDDSFAADVWIYYPDKTHSESFKIYPVSKLQGFLDCICASYDLENYQISEIQAKMVKKNGKIENGILGIYKPYKRNIKMGKKEFANEFDIIPTFDINFDLTDMNSMLPYLIDARKDFSFGLTNVNKASLLAGPQFLYLGELKCSYLQDETYKDKDCSVFSMSLENFEELDGKLYVENGTNDLVEINTQLSGNPFYQSFKLTLLDKKQITIDEWISFMKEKAKEEL